MNEKVDTYIEKQSSWRTELEFLRSLMLDLGLEETYKWNAPVYMYKGTNLLSLNGFKKHGSVTFFKGRLLSNSRNIFQPIPEETISMANFRFTCMEEVLQAGEALREYVFEAMEVEDLGLKAEKSLPKELVLPQILIEYFSNDRILSNMFHELTPARKAMIVRHLTDAKQVETRQRRLEQIIPLIYKWKGLNH